MEHLTEYQLLDYSGREMPAAEAEITQRHLLDCAECRGALSRLQADLSAIREAFPAEPDAVFWAAYPVRLRERMTVKKKRIIQVFLPEWITALAGISFALTLAFMLATGKMYLNEVPMSYGEWSQAYIYQPLDATESKDIVDYALAKVVEVPDWDFIPLGEDDIFDLLQEMTDAELTVLFEDMANYDFNKEG